MGRQRIIDHFLRQVASYPLAKAVVFNQDSITYNELDKKSTYLAKAIIATTADEQIIGISTTRSIEMIIGLLAILKAGKTYMPIDPLYPVERLNNMLEISAAKFVVAEKDEEETWRALGLSRIDYGEQPENPDIELPQKAQEVYALFFTSGSTGKPKGVMVTTQGAVELIEHKLKHSRAAGIGVKTLQFCHLGFDISVKEIFVALSSGGELHLVEDLQRLDAHFLLDYMCKHGINTVFLPNVSLQYLTQAAVSTGIFPTDLTELNTGGELLQITHQVREFFKNLPNAVLKNNYGPTEASMWASEINLEGPPDSWEEIPSIGKPLANCRFWILDENLREVPQNEPGELHISGECLSKGYLNRDDLTQMNYLDWTNALGKTLRIYKTGDFAVQKQNGEFYFQGRKDDQIKIRGNRVELGEIESALTNLSDIRHAVVKIDQDENGHKYLCGYILLNEGVDVDIPEIKNALKSKIPEYMIPDYLIKVDKFPKTNTGKVDKKALPKPKHQRPEWAPPYEGPRTELEKNIQSVFLQILNYDKIGIHDNFFEFGGNSLKAQRTIAEFKMKFGMELPIIKLYQFPSIAQVASYFSKDKKPVNFDQPRSKISSKNKDVAIIGMAFKFPGANTVDEFLEILRGGKETIRFFRPEELDVSIPAEKRNDPNFVAARGLVDGYDQFDAAFFGLNPKLAAIADPQLRKFLEVAFEVLDRAGYRKEDSPLHVGVFAGSSNNSYFNHNLFSQKKLLDSFGDFMVLSLNEKDYLATRTAYHLNLTGPAVSVHSACSTALLAVHQAVESIREGKCNMAIAGASSIKSPANNGHVFEEGSVYSKDGHVRSFDAEASGTVFSDGVGVVLLKDLESALSDGDEIYAVVKGGGVNNDGGMKGSFSAPSSEGQAGAIYAAIQDAGVDPENIGYIEAHATATPIGDPIEIEGLKLAFGNNRSNQYCALGSVKGNIGHLNSAAGIAGLIRAILTLKHKQYFPQCGFQKLNPSIGLDNSPFFIPSGLMDWESESPRIAGVSSFGVGGTNVHLILEEAPSNPLDELQDQSVDYPAYLVNWSAKSEESLRLYAGNLVHFLEKNPDLELSELVYNLQHKKADFPFRSFITASTKEELKQQMLNGEFTFSDLKEQVNEFVFLFPGQGSQYLNMAKELYACNKIFKNAVDTCSLILEQEMDISILDVLYPEVMDEDAEEILKNTKNTQPAIFVIEYALSQLWMSLGIKPIILCGHSVGEFVAAHLAEIFSLEDALKLVAKRGKMISELPGGYMLSIRCKEEEIIFLMPENISLAGVNSGNQCVVSGEKQDILDFADLLETKDIPSTVLKTSHAFHSFMMDPILDEFSEFVSTLERNKPRIPIISTVTGDFLTDEQAQSVSYWTNQLRNPVRFAAASRTLLDLDMPLSFLEVGPGNVLISLMKQSLNSQNRELWSSLSRRKGLSDFNGLLQTVGNIWQRGKNIKWDNLFNLGASKIELPTYSFKQDKIWIYPVVSGAEVNLQNDMNTSSFSYKPIEGFRGNHSIINRKEKIREKIIKLIQETTGLVVADGKATFIELGFDSLLLTQLASGLKQTFNIHVTFRQLNESLDDLDVLVDFYDKELPVGMFDDQIKNPPMSSVELTSETQSSNSEDPLQQLDTISKAINEIKFKHNQAQVGSLMEIFSKQLEVISQQIKLMGMGIAQVPNTSPPKELEFPKESVGKSDKFPMETAPFNPPNTFGSIAKIEKVSSELTRDQDNFLLNMINRFKTKSSNVGFFGEMPKSSGNSKKLNLNEPPVPGAKLGKDPMGNPAWFIRDENKPGKFIKVNTEVKDDEKL